MQDLSQAIVKLSCVTDDTCCRVHNTLQSVSKCSYFYDSYWLIAVGLCLELFFTSVSDICLYYQLTSISCIQLFVIWCTLSCGGVVFIAVRTSVSYWMLSSHTGLLAWQRWHELCAWNWWKKSCPTTIPCSFRLVFHDFVNVFNCS